MTKAIDRAGLTQIKAVPFTDTWRPVHHKTVVDLIDETLLFMGLEPQGGYHLEVSDDGMDMFGRVSVKTLTPDHKTLARTDALGFRNSMKKNFSLGFVAGSRIIVCSNMQFHGEFKEFMRHDQRMTDEALEGFINNAIETIQDEQGRYRAWFDQAVHLPLTEQGFKARSWDLMARGILHTRLFNRYLDCVEEERKDQRYDHEFTVGLLQGAATRTLRESTTRQQMQRTRLLHDFMTEMVPMTEEDLI